MANTNIGFIEKRQHEMFAAWTEKHISNIHKVGFDIRSIKAFNENLIGEMHNQEAHNHITLGGVRNNSDIDTHPTPQAAAIGGPAASLLALLGIGGDDQRCKLAHSTASQEEAAARGPHLPPLRPEL
ncbi:MAG: hypothetical protein ACKERG_04255 [Candidatus Hodgkinia cicadicola]